MTKEKDQTGEPLTLARAQQRLKEIEEHRSDLESRQASLNARIGSAQVEAVRRYLAGDRQGIREATELRVEIEAIRSALELLALDEKAAAMSVERAKVDDLRDQAERKRAELEQLNAQTGALLSRLSEIEGVRYTHSILSSQPMDGAWLQPYTINAPHQWEGVMELALSIPHSPQKLGVPRSRKLRIEIDALEIEAVVIEQKLRREETKAA